MFILFLLILAGLLFMFRIRFRGVFQAIGQFLNQITAQEGDETQYFPYKKRMSLLSLAEKDFLTLLQNTLGSRFQILTKVRLADILAVDEQAAGQQGHYRRLAEQHVDFVLCDETLAPKLVIELSDAQQKNTDRRNRDAFVDAALDHARLPVMHIAAQQSYNMTALRSRIEEKLTMYDVLEVEVIAPTGVLQENLR